MSYLWLNNMNRTERLLFRRWDKQLTSFSMGNRILYCPMLQLYYHNLLRNKMLEIISHDLR